jgi:hypothetical protein
MDFSKLLDCGLAALSHIKTKEEMHPYISIIAVAGDPTN